jgi:hypothetical protein
LRKAQAKKKLFQALALLLKDKGEDLFPDDIADGSMAYKSCDLARAELVEEFERRGEEKDDEWPP